MKKFISKLESLSSWKYSFLLPLIAITNFQQAFAIPAKNNKAIKYRPYFGSCPSRSAGKLTLKLVEEFEKKGSLKAIKEKIIKDRLKDKYFLSNYKVSYDPLKKYLKFYYDCPDPLMKVQVYKKNGMESYSAILVENGLLFDPTYEVLLQAEGKLNYELPSLAIPIGEIDSFKQSEISDVVSRIPLEFRKKLSEIILSQNNELTIILSIRGRPSSAFLGLGDWNTKVKKLQKIVRYMEAKKRIPAIINLTNSKKVVVKFSDKF